MKLELLPSKDDEANSKVESSRDVTPIYTGIERRVRIRRMIGERRETIRLEDERRNVKERRTKQQTWNWR